MHGLAQGDFTATVVGDSYLIREGKLASPLRPNTIRINDNIRRLLLDIAAISKERGPALVWDGRGIVYTPEIAIRELRVDAIAENEQ
jgi:predicted Zn-dependent protease